MQELESSQYPVGAIIQGIRSLRDDDLRSLKLSHLVEAIRKYVDYDLGRVECGYCGREGAVMMFDDEQRIHALACKCSNGDIVQEAQGLVRWTGQPIMMSNERRLYKDRLMVGSKEPILQPQDVDEAIKDLVEAVGGQVTDPGVTV